MAVFEYKAFSPGGRLETGIIDADSAKSARAKLRKQGVFPTELVEERGGRDDRPGSARSSAAARAAGGEAAPRKIREVDLRKLFARRRVSTQDLAVMTRQLATLLAAGISMIEALAAQSEQVENERLKVALSAIKEKVNEGSGLAQAMRAYPAIFGDLYCNMIAAGEASGSLDIVLKRLSDFLEAQVQLNNRLLSAMVYPVIMTFVGLGVVGFLMGFVVPKITSIFADMKMALPLVTRVLIGISRFIADWWWLLGIFACFAAFAVGRWKRTESGRSTWDRWSLRLPVFGKLLQLVAVARFSRTLATLLSSGVSLLQSLVIVKAIVSNVHIQAAIEETRISVQEGESIAEPLRRSKQFPAVMVHMVAVGERSGELEGMLEKVADAYENEAKTRIDMMTSFLEPVMILVMGLVVGFIAVSIILPMLQMNNFARG